MLLDIEEGNCETTTMSISHMLLNGITITFLVIYKEASVNWSGIWTNSSNLLQLELWPCIQTISNMLWGDMDWKMFQPTWLSRAQLFWNTGLSYQW